MSPRAAVVVATLALAVALAALVVALTPWQPLPTGEGRRVAADPALDFTAGQLAREDAFHAAIRPPAYVSYALAALLAIGLGLTPVGARIVEKVAAPSGGGWWWQVLLGTVALTALGRVLVLPWDAWAESVRRDYGLSTRSWPAWGVDVAKGYAVGLVVTLLLVALVLALARWSPEWWWSVAAVLAAALVVGVSFVYPLVVEPVFNKFEPMQRGALRSSLLQLAERDGVPVEDVLVADASRRTSALNAYVSGFGASRRIVVYDTLLERASDEEVGLIVAHELGHVKSRDVVWGTALGAVGVAFAVCLLALAARSDWVLARAGVPVLGDGRAVALVLAFAASVGVLSSPAQALLSRRIETRADVHALDLTRAPDVAVTMQRRLSVTNLSDLDPPAVVFGMFATHPTGPQRIALARTWSQQNDVPVPEPITP